MKNQSKRCTLWRWTQREKAPTKVGGCHLWLCHPGASGNVRLFIQRQHKHKPPPWALTLKTKTGFKSVWSVKQHTKQSCSWANILPCGQWSSSQSRWCLNLSFKAQILFQRDLVVLQREKMQGIESVGLIKANYLSPWPKHEGGLCGGVIGR